jgi:nucleoside-diphosphate-sugar epimerase
VYIDDVVDALVAAATAADVDQRVINIGSGRETSINDLVAAVGEATGKGAIEPIHTVSESAGVKRLCADLALAQHTLGYSPKISLEEGLRLMLERDPQFAERARSR